MFRPAQAWGTAVATLEIQGLFWVPAEIRLMREQKPVSQPVGPVPEQQLRSASGGSADPKEQRTLGPRDTRGVAALPEGHPRTIHPGTRASLLAQVGRWTDDDT